MTIGNGREFTSTNRGEDPGEGPATNSGLFQLGGSLARMRLAQWMLVLALASCATLRPPDIDDLKPAVEAFHRAVRWKDYRGAADMIVPERREAFLKARKQLKDERDLYISDFQLEDAKVSKAGIATAVSHMSWYRLPSATESTVTITSIFVWRNNVWILESQDDGPFEDLKPAPEKAKEPEAAKPRDAGETKTP